MVVMMGAVSVPLAVESGYCILGMTRFEKELAAFLVR